MSLTTGTRLGPYEILSPLGAGGMGEVWKARDTRLDRTVAIKTVNGPFTERFEREARAISALNHPHICTLYDVGEHEGAGYLVMELVEGAPLAGPIPLERAVTYGAQICSALEAAHRKVIVHRDLKPANILVTKSGVKLLDFGLARIGAGRAGRAGEAGGVGGVGQDETDAAVTKALTGAHTIVGTPQYMAPEQIEGKDADARTDIFAFGCVLYELLTGQKAFDGKTPSSVMAAILATEPRPMTELQPLTPASIERVVRRCLAKDPDDRWQTARDLRAELDWIATGESKSESAEAQLKRTTKYLPWVVAGALAIASAALTAALWQARHAPAEVPTATFEIPTPVSGRRSAKPAVSPDGHWLAFILRDDTGRSRMIVRALDSVAFQELAGTDGADTPSWSDDSRYLVFNAAGKLKKIAVTGGPPQILCDFPGGIPFASMSLQGVVLFTGRDGTIWRVAASGGIPEPVTALDPSRYERRHSLPQFLPDGRHFLYLSQSGQPEKNGMFVGSLESKEGALVFTTQRAAFFARTVAGGDFLIFGREGALLAQSFDASAFRLKGEAFPIASPVGYNADHPLVGVSNTGVLAYSSSIEGVVPGVLGWFDREGRPLGVIGAPGPYSEFSLSPDEQRVAVARLDPENWDVWILDLQHDGLGTRFTTDPGRDRLPIWSAGGRRITFGSDRTGATSIYEKSATEPASEHPVANLLGAPLHWSVDGRHLLYRPGNDLLVWTDGKFSTPFTQTAFDERGGQFSPDGKWIAYTSDESKQTEVYVQGFPSGPRHKISIAGGGQPQWASNGHELFYVDLVGQLIAVPITLDGGFEFRKPVPLFKTSLSVTGLGLGYAVSRDGQRFLVESRSAASSEVAPVTVMTNWLAGAKQ